MATTFKPFLNSDIVTTKTLLHEAIPITGSLVSGTYNKDGSLSTELNIKNYSHKMFQSVYDYPYLSSSANHIFDITLGFSTGSALSGVLAEVARTEQEEKIAIYNQMAQILMGHDQHGNVRAFDQDGDVVDSQRGKINEAFFISFARLLVKDEIKKGSFSMELGVAPNYGSPDSPSETSGDLRKYTGRTITVKDTNAQNDYRINSPAGEYGILSASSTQASGAIAHGATTGSLHPTKPGNIGLVFYQAGIVVLDARVFAKAAAPTDQTTGPGFGGAVNRFVTASTTAGGGHHAKAAGNPTVYALTGGILNSASCMMHKQIVDAAGIDITALAQADVYSMLTGSTIQTGCSALRRRIKQISFNNTTELNSTVYFCRANHNEFNYSSNPTYLTESKIRVKNSPSDMPVSYITSVGLYSPDNELMATAKLSEPLRKDPTNELTLRVRLDY
jgi:hypothetical protein